MSQPARKAKPKRSVHRWVPGILVMKAVPGARLEPVPFARRGGHKSEFFYADFQSLAQSAWKELGPDQRAGEVTIEAETTFPAGALPSEIVQTLRADLLPRLERVLRGSDPEAYQLVSDDGRFQLRVTLRFRVFEPSGDAESSLANPSQVGQDAKKEASLDDGRQEVGDERKRSYEAAHDAESGLRELLETVDGYRAKVRLEVGLRLQEYLRTRDPDTYEEKQKIAAQVGAVLKRLGFGIRYRSHDCYLSTGPMSKTSGGRFLLLTIGSKDRLIQKARLPQLLKELGPLDLSDVAPDVTLRSSSPDPTWADRERERATAKKSPRSTGK